MKFTNTIREAIVRAIMQDVPKIDAEKTAKEIAEKVEKAMSPAVRRFAKAHPTAIRTASVRYAHPHNYYGSIPVGDVNEDQIREIVRPYEEALGERDAMQRKLTTAFAGISTLKQALTAFPEFEKYYPTEAQPTKNLPALANVVADLSRLGWPNKKGEKK